MRKLQEKDKITIPIYQASEKTEKAYKKAVKEYEAGETLKVKDVDKFFQNTES